MLEHISKIFVTFMWWLIGAVSLVRMCVYHWNCQDCGFTFMFDGFVMICLTVCAVDVVKDFIKYLKGRKG